MVLSSEAWLASNGGERDYTDAGSRRSREQTEGHAKVIVGDDIASDKTPVNTALIRRNSDAPIVAITLRAGDIREGGTAKAHQIRRSRERTAHVSTGSPC